MTAGHACGPVLVLPEHAEPAGRLGAIPWRVAYALDVLLRQLNALAPHRSRASDGSIGDAAHASRTSDHNAWIVLLGVGIVTARDFTHDPAGGLDCHALAAALVASLDRRIKYIIWARRIWTPARGWQPYVGTNPHDKHLHLSAVATPALFDDVTPWALGALAPREDDDMTEDQARQLADAVKMLGALHAVVVHPTKGADGELLARSRTTDAGVAALLARKPGETITPAAIAAAIPDSLAQAVVDALATRLERASV